MRVFLTAILVSASILALPLGRGQTADAATCKVSGAPVIVPMIVGAAPSGSFSWTGPACGTSSGTWTSANGGGTASYTSGAGAQVRVNWYPATNGATFIWGCTTCSTESGSWTLTSGGGAFEYSCADCGGLMQGTWETFGSSGGSYHYACGSCVPVYGVWSQNPSGGSFRLSCAACDDLAGYWSWSAAPTPTPSPTPRPSPSPAPCVTTVGPGIAPPSSVTTGIPGLHAAWYGQSGYPSMCPGDRVTLTFPFINSGSVGWGAGSPVAFLGTWVPEPGQDMPSFLGGDGTHGSPGTGWPAYNRPAIQPAPYVGPGQVAWFQIAIQAPAVPGTYRLAVRPVIEGVTWLEDYGVFVYVTVKTS